MPVSDNDRVQELCETASPVVGNPRETVKKKFYWRMAAER